MNKTSLLAMTTQSFGETPNNALANHIAGVGNMVDPGSGSHRRFNHFPSLAALFRKFGDESIPYNWLRKQNTIEFLGIWEHLYNPGFKPLEFDRFRSQAGLNSFALSPKILAALTTQSFGKASGNGSDHHFAGVGKPIPFGMGVA